jgi:hypothetical protein
MNYAFHLSFKKERILGEYLHLSFKKERILGEYLKD